MKQIIFGYSWHVKTVHFCGFFMTKHGVVWFGFKDELPVEQIENMCVVSLYMYTLLVSLPNHPIFYDDCEGKFSKKANLTSSPRQRAPGPRIRRNQVPAYLQIKLKAASRRASCKERWRFPRDVRPDTSRWFVSACPCCWVGRDLLQGDFFFWKTDVSL